MLSIIKAAIDTIAGNAVASLAIVALLGGVYTGIAVRHYNKGWAAHERSVAREIRRVNQERAQLNKTLAEERRTRSADEARITADAVAATQRYCRDVPEACGIATGTPTSSREWRTEVVKTGVCASRCGTPERIRNTLNSIK